MFFCSFYYFSFHLLFSFLIYFSVTIFKIFILVFVIIFYVFFVLMFGIIFCCHFAPFLYFWKTCSKRTGATCGLQRMMPKNGSRENLTNGQTHLLTFYQGDMLSFYVIYIISLWLWPFKGTIAWDFSPPFSFIKSTHLGPWFLS
jgi:hypothetical protein